MSDKDPINIAKQVYNYNKENPDNSRVTPLLPPGVVGNIKPNRLNQLF